jgi:hypothetical protein
MDDLSIGPLPPSPAPDDRSRPPAERRRKPRRRPPAPPTPPPEDPPCDHGEAPPAGSLDLLV